jgi:hypothetical protein
VLLLRLRLLPCDAAADMADRNLPEGLRGVSVNESARAWISRVLEIRPGEADHQAERLAARSGT